MMQQSTKGDMRALETRLSDKSTAIPIQGKSYEIPTEGITQRPIIPPLGRYDILASYGVFGKETEEIRLPEGVKQPNDKHHVYAGKVTRLGKSAYFQ
jgi:hypothetical protein